MVRFGSPEGEWCAATEKNPCPICGSVTGPCSGNADDDFVSCTHCPSDWPLTTGAWLHRLPVVAERAPQEEGEEPSLADHLLALARVAGTGV
jgi:hypothetical protein